MSENTNLNASERYKIVGILGEGGMGTVYVADDLRLPGKQWAVKEIPIEEGGETDLAREAELLIRLSHPNLPQIVDFYASPDDRHGYLVMEKLDGQTLEQLFIASGKRVTARDLLPIAIQVCDALAYMHALQPDPIIHRDLKPSNIWINKRGGAILIDFGTARIYKPDKVNDTVQLGTLGFAAPEQITGAQTDGRTDLYALGCILYFLLSGGRYPLGRDLPLQMPKEQIHPELWDLIEQLLQRDKNDRPQNATLVKERLQLIFTRLSDQGDMRNVRAKSAITIPSKKRIILLLSLYPGAGSTTIGLGLAAHLDRWNIPHTYMELPGIEPTLTNWVEHPEESTDWMEQSLLGQQLDWTLLPATGQTTWITVDKSSRNRSWSTEAHIRLLYNLDCPIVLIDASHIWDTESLLESVQLADEIVVVSGPHLMQLHRDSTARNMKQAISWGYQCKSVLLATQGRPSVQSGAQMLYNPEIMRQLKLPWTAGWLEHPWTRGVDAMLERPELKPWNNQIAKWLRALLDDWGYRLADGATGRGRLLTKLWTKGGV